MSQTSLSFKEVEIDKKELTKRLGGQAPGELLGDRESKIIGSLSPVYMVRDSSIAVKENGVSFDFGYVESRNLVMNLLGCSRAHIVVVSLGAQADRLLKRAALTSVSEQFLVDAMLSAYAESCIDHLQKNLYDGEMLKPRFAPGYGDFDISWQKEILSFLDAGRIGVTVNDSMLLVPTKTITAVIGVRDNYE